MRQKLELPLLKNYVLCFLIFIAPRAVRRLACSVNNGSCFLRGRTSKSSVESSLIAKSKKMDKVTRHNFIRKSLRLRQVLEKEIRFINFGPRNNVITKTKKMEMR